MIDRSHALPVTRQARELGISRGSVYYLPRPVSATDLLIMRRIDELHMDFPFAGSRMLRDLLAAEGVKVGRLHVSTLMKKMAIEAIYRRPNTSKPAPGHKVYPYLLRELAAVDHTGDGLLHRGAGGSADALRPAGDFQYGPGQPVHLHGLHVRPAPREDRDQHGRSRRLAGQCVCRAPVALGQIRGGLSAGIRIGQRGPHIARPVSEFLQWPTPALIA